LPFSWSSPVKSYFTGEIKNMSIDGKALKVFFNKPFSSKMRLLMPWFFDFSNLLIRNIKYDPF